MDIRFSPRTSLIIFIGLEIVGLCILAFSIHEYVVFQESIDNSELVVKFSTSAPYGLLGLLAPLLHLTGYLHTRRKLFSQRVANTFSITIFAFLMVASWLWGKHYLDYSAHAGYVDCHYESFARSPVVPGKFYKYAKTRYQCPSPERVY